MSGASELAKALTRFISSSVAIGLGWRRMARPGLRSALETTLAFTGPPLVTGLPAAVRRDSQAGFRRRACLPTKDLGECVAQRLFRIVGQGHRAPADVLVGADQGHAVLFDSRVSPPSRNSSSTTSTPSAEPRVPPLPRSPGRHREPPSASPSRGVQQPGCIPVTQSHPRPPPPASTRS